MNPLCKYSFNKDNNQRVNNTYIIKNGKKYKIIKIRRNECVNHVAKDQKIQRRTFNNVNINSLVHNFSSIFPIQWMTKKGLENNMTGNGNKTTDLETSASDWEFLSKLRYPDDKWERKPFQDTFNYPGEKLKKLLNLFTIVQFDNGGCYVDGLKGTCFHQLECQVKGGRSIGLCAKGFGVCCYIEKTCGQRTHENCTYFVNEGFPKPSTAAPKVCSLTVDKAHPDVTQLRLEFQTFELRGPSNGTCISDRFIVSGQNTNNIVPEICGMNTGQHMYVDIDESNGPYNLNVITMGQDLPRTFRIKITQLKRKDELEAPKNCLQYYTEPAGFIQSFNYQYGNNGNPPEATPGYFNNLNYVVCLKKERGFCTVTYDNSLIGVDPSFQLTNVDQGGERLVPPQQAGAEVFNCPDDYIVVNGIRLCGERLNDASTEIDYTKNYPVIDKSNGPFVLQVKTNEAVTGRGFYLKYNQNPCLF